MDDTTWDTDEVELWLANDEWLYHAALERRDSPTLMRDLRDLVELAEIDVNLSNVDWINVAHFVMEDL